ncbi:MAG TPA: hypothetical protein DIT49_00135 [Clostridiales bacterium]|nr:hypothetical protein [Clostridiales bacterium]
MKKVIPLICILLTVTVCVFGIVFLSTHTDSPEEETPNSESYRTPLHASVESGIITSTLSSKVSITDTCAHIIMFHGGAHANAMSAPVLSAIT